MWKKLAIVVVAGGGAAAAIYAVQSRNGGPEPVAVEAEQVEKQTIVQTVTATGRIQPHTQVNISADVSAKITALPHAEGDRVDQGELLVELDRERHQAALEIAAASVNAAASNAELARENMIKAEKDHERIAGLFRRNLESQASLDASHAGAEAEKARYRAALDQVEQARAALKQAEDDLSKTRIYAPAQGTISQLNKEVGEIALGSQFQEDVIMVIANLSGMEAVVDVDENDIVSVASGDQASVEVDALPGVTLTGKVTEIANSAKLTAQGGADQKTEFEVKVAIVDHDTRLRPGMTASAEIVTETKTGVLGVPIQAVAVRTVEQLSAGALAEAAPLNALEGDKDGFVELVFVVDGERVAVRQVTTGIQSDSHIEIVSGLAAGDPIVIGNYRAVSKDLEHGTLVSVKAEAESPQVVARK